MADCTGVISQMFIYPIKSCAGIEISESPLLNTGLLHDREWMIVDQEGQFLTQRQIPHMVWITPRLTEEALYLNAPDHKEIRVAFNDVGMPKQVTVWRDTLMGDDMGDAVAAWLDAFLAVPGKQFRLIRFSPQASRLSAKEWTGDLKAPNMFSDGFALLVVTQRALEVLNERLMAEGFEAVDMLRFRPNLVLEGLDAHIEDELSHLLFHTAVGKIDLRLVKPCGRCPIPNIDPYTATSTPEVMNALSAYRRLDRMHDAVCFGMNAIIRSGARQTLRVGQPFEADFAV
jgi:uncharacterized protein YcbX